MFTNAFQLKSPLKEGTFDRDLSAFERLQSTRALDAADCARLDAYLERHPETPYRLYTEVPGKPVDYAFLALLPALRHLWIEADAGDLVDLSPLRVLPEGLVSLGLDTVQFGSDPKRDRPKTGTAALGHLRHLGQLSVCGRLRDLAFLADLGRLEALSLWRNRLATLAGIEVCGALRSLDLRSAGPRDLAPIAALTSLRMLSIDHHPGITSIEPLLALRDLRQLRLLSCSITTDLPSLHGMTSLRVLLLDKLVTPSNLANIAAAPALRCLILDRSPALHAIEALRPLAGHPTLRELRLDSDNDGLHKAIRDTYGWKVAYANYPADEYLVDDPPAAGR
ncbi:hypothetical protein ACQQ2N_05375 [Dokdonella sp. MW10]|uniref:hypothetical protein n=1 Tax=Dokdonella sp. MW10 TaxID=2992926 RepID=UPI003F7F3C65